MAVVLITLAVLMPVLLGIFYLKHFYRRRREGEPSIVPGNLIFGSGIEFGANAVSFLHKCRAAFGEVFTIRLINQHLTIIMDPHSYDTVSKERNFDFDAIQKQVNMNVFSFVLKDARTMIKETGKTVRGKFLDRGLANFDKHLGDAVTNVANSMEDSSDWNEIGLINLTSDTMFTAVFETVFGKSDDHPFNPKSVYTSFEEYHRYFNYLWLGLPRGLFPSATKALENLVCQPCPEDLLARDDCSDYIKFAIEHMQKRGQVDAEIMGHNLVYLHVNYNTFRLAFWCMYYMLSNEECLKAVREELEEAIESKISGDHDTASFTFKEVEEMKYLNSLINESFRIASGVFMVRYVTDDTKFTSSDGKEYLIRKGDRVAIYPPAIHKDPEVFEDPLTFKYDRFVDAKFYHNGKVLKQPIMPFGTLCPGQRFAILQTKWYLLNMLNSLDMELPKAQNTVPDVHYHGHEILPPAGDVRCMIRIREERYKLELVP